MIKRLLKNNYKIIFKIIIVLILIQYLISKIDIIIFKELIKRFTGINIITILFMFVLQFVVLAFKWRTLIPNCKLATILETILYGHAMNYAIGGQLVGEGTKIIALGKKENNYGLISASVIMDKLLGLISCFFVGTVGLFFASVSIPKTLVFIYFGISICLITGLFLISNKKIQIILSNCINKLKGDRYNKIINFIESMLNACKLFTSSNKVIVLNIIYGVIYQILAVVVSYCICRYLMISVRFFDFSWIMAVTSLIGLIPLSFAGFGISQMSAIALMGIIGITDTESFTYSIVLYAFCAFIAIIGFIWYIISGKKTKTN